VRVDVRVVAATNCDLERAVAAGAFREDLYFRINVVEITLPPLRERRDDIPLLTDHFLKTLQRGARRPSVTALSAETMQLFASYDWPGNVRELENLVERLVIVAGQRAVAVRDLPGNLRGESPELDAGPLDLPLGGVDLRTLLADLEDRLIGQALARTGGNRNRAAELLGLNRTTLVEKLRRRNVA